MSSQTNTIEIKSKSPTPLIQSDGVVPLSFSIRYSDLLFDDRNNPLGQGAYGYVYKGRWDFNPVAIKEYTTQDFSEQTQKDIRLEATVMAQVSTQSEYLVRLKGISLEKPHYCLVMEYMPGGDLYHFLHKPQPISWNVRYRIALDIGIGLHHLHSKDILHRDLKSFNVLLDSNGRAKLVDFGSAKMKASSAATTEGGFKGTILWAAPETFTDKPTKRSDVYSAGVVLWELASREMPYKDAGGMVVEWIKGGKTETVPEGTPEEFKKVILSCWQAPEKRPEAKVLAEQLDQLWQADQKEEVKIGKVSSPPSLPPNPSFFAPYVPTLASFSLALQEKKSPALLEKEFSALLQHYQKQSPSESTWREFLPLVHDYLQQCLPLRDTLFKQYCHQKALDALALVRQLLQQVEQVELQVQKCLGHRAWLDFCRKVHAQLTQNSYYQPEGWLIQASEHSAVIPLPSTIFYSSWITEIGQFPLEEMTAQALRDERLRRQFNWERQKPSIDQSSLPAVCAFQTKILQELAKPVGWTELEQQQALQTYVLPYWQEETGLQRITQGVRAAASQPWSVWQNTHQVLYHFLQNVQPQEEKLAQKIREHYQTALIQWRASQQESLTQQAQKAQKLAEEQKPLAQRYASWEEGFKQKAQELKLDFNASLSPESLPPQNTKESYAKPLELETQALTLWENHKDFAELKRHSHDWEGAWKNARNQNRPEAPQMHKVLTYAYQRAERSVRSAFEAKRQSLQAEQETVLQQQKQGGHTLVALDRALQEINSQSLPPQESKATLLSGVPVERKEAKVSKDAPFEKRWEYFCQQLDAAVQRILSHYGAPPCAFTLIAWPVDTPFLFSGRWSWGVLLSDPAQATHEDLALYLRLIHNYILSLTQQQALPLAWLPASDSLKYFIDLHHATPYRHGGRMLVSSDGNASLRADYQKSIQTLFQQLDSEHKVPRGRLIAQQEMKSTWNLLPPASSTTSLESKALFCDPVQSLQRPLLLWLRDAATYYGLAPDTPENLMTQLEDQRYFHPDFIADLRAAYAWVADQAAALEEAWHSQTPPTGLLLGQAQLSQDSKPSSAFELSAQDYHHHHRYTLGLLQSTGPETLGRWCSTEDIHILVDPLVIQAQKLLEQAASSKLLDEEAYAMLDEVIEFIKLRPSRFLIHKHMACFLKLTQKRQLYYVEHLISHLNSKEQQAPTGVIYRLRQAPSHSGRRIRWKQEQVEWQNQILPKLWVAEQKTIPHESKDPSIQISVMRPTDESQSAWEVHTHTLRLKVAQELFDYQGHWKPRPVETVEDHQGKETQRPKYSGNHRVFPLEIEGQRFWVKAYPEQPAMEWLVHQLDRRLGVFGTPRFEVVKFHHGGQTSCALISEHIAGDTLRKVIEKSPQVLENLAFDSFARTLLRVLLINPEDDKDDDYLLSEESKEIFHLKRIDNERAFFEPLVANDNLVFNKTTLQVKSVIYCLEHMRVNWPKNPATQDLLQEWRQMRAVSLLQDLLQEAHQQHAAWKELFSLSEVQHHFKLPDPEKSLPLMFIPQGLTKEIITRLTLIQTALRLANPPSDAKQTPQEAKTYPLCGLSLLQDTQPKLAEYYAKAHWQSLTPEERKSDSVITLNHHRVHQRFKDHVGCWYQRNSQGGLVSGISGSQAIQTSLRFPHPLKPDELKDIWEGRKSSPIQELAVLTHWHKARLETLTQSLIAPMAAVLAELKKLPPNRGIKNQAEEEQLWRSYQRRLAEEFRALPLRQRHRMWLTFRQKLRENQLDVEQQLFLLNAMTGVGWEQLDLSSFHPDLITEKCLTALLQGGQQEPPIPLKTLDISGCHRLTGYMLPIIHRYSQKTLKQLKCNRLPWQTIALEQWDELSHFECQESKLTKLTFDAVPKLTTLDFSESSIDTISGSASQLMTLRLRYCHSLTQLGAREASFWQNRFLSLPRLQYLDIEFCTSLESLYLPMPTSIFLDHLIPQLDLCPKLKDIELQTTTEWNKIDFNFLRVPLKSKSKILDFSDKNRLTPKQLKTLALFYLPHDRYFTVLDLSEAQLDDRSIALLAPGLAQNKTLTHLDLSGNKITVEGAKAIGTMLQSNTSLISLDLWGNDIGWKGADAIAAAMETNTTLQEFRHHYAHYEVKSWNKNNKTQWREVGDCIKRRHESKSVSPASFWEASSSQPISEKKQSQPRISTHVSIAPTAHNPIKDVKRNSSLLDEKAKQKFLELQNKLVIACEKGNSTAVKKAISQGALSDQPNAAGKQPLYAAVYGMNPEIVNYLISQRSENAPPISWQSCEDHNKKQYGQTFLIMKFAPVYYKDWYELLLRIGPNEFLAGYHLARCQDSWGVGDKDCEEFAYLRGYVNGGPYHLRGIGGSHHFLHTTFRSNDVEAHLTEKGYESYRDQIKLAMEGLQVEQTNQSR